MPNTTFSRILRIRPVEATAEQIVAQYEPDAIGAWWGAGEPPSEVLVHTGTEVTLAWPEQRGVIGLKNFSMGGQRAVALDFHGWGLEPGATAGLEDRLDATLDGLAARLA